MKKFRLIEIIEADGAMQMAIDEAIAIACSEGKCFPTLRFYKFNPPTITLGIGQKISNFNLDEIKKKKFDCVRRITGGTAVLHKNDLVYSLILHEDFLPHKVIDAYNYLSDGLVNGLQQLGLDAYKRLAKSKKRKDSCYLNDNPYDVVVNNKKISGNAQARLYGVVLQHGTIIVENNLEQLFECLIVSDKKNLLKEAEKKVTCIEEELKTKISLSKLEQAMCYGFKELFSKKEIVLETGVLTDYELNLAKKLYEEKYSKKDWNYKF